MNLTETLEVRDLIVNFYTDHGVVEALDGCSLAVRRGEVVGLVGESGCGKSTMAKAILGVIPSPPGKVLGGEVIFQGQDLLQMEENKLNSLIRGRAVTMVPQDPFSSFSPVFTIGTQIMDIMRWKSSQSSDAGRGNRHGSTNISKNRSKDKRRADRERVIAMLRQLQIPSPESQLRKYPHQLSGGQRQRMMIAMALLPDPSLIIADEPTTALDVTIEAQILQLLGHLVKDYEVSVLFITHDLGVASQICDRVVIMYAGQEVESAPITSFFAKPSHPYTKKLLESLPNPKGEIMDIPGEVPSLIDPPTGCRFHPRCESAMPKCKQERPMVEEIFPNHWIRCFNPVAGATKSVPGAKLVDRRD